MSEGDAPVRLGGREPEATAARDDAAYSAAGLGGRLRYGSRPAVVVVDFSYGFTDPASPLGSEVGSTIQATNRLLGVARSQGNLCVFTTVSFDPDGSDGGIWVQKNPASALLHRGSRWAEIDARVGRRQSEPIIDRRGPSAVFGTNLVAILISNHVDTVILCGVTTSGCIRATAVDLLQYGFPTLIPESCVADRAAGPHHASLFDLDAKYADVVQLDDALAYLEGAPGGKESPGA